jgi:hypothetical protein
MNWGAWAAGTTLFVVGFIITKGLVDPFFVKGQNMIGGRTITAGGV